MLTLVSALIEKDGKEEFLFANLYREECTEGYTPITMLEYIKQMVIEERNMILNFFIVEQKETSFFSHRVRKGSILLDVVFRNNVRIGLKVKREMLIDLLDKLISIQEKLAKKEVK